MRDFERTKQEILDRVDLVGFVSEHVRLKNAGGRRWVGLCPFHQEKTPSFTVSPDLGIFKCFGCGRGGDLFSFVQQMENVGFGESLRMLADRAGVSLASERNERGGRDDGETSVSRRDIVQVNEWALRLFRSNFVHATRGEFARSYARKRGFSDETVDAFEFGLATDGGSDLLDAARNSSIDLPKLVAADLVRESDNNRNYDTFRNRLMFPIRDVSGRVIAFGGRTLGDDRAKYLNTRQTVLFHKGRTLFGIDRARRAISQDGRAVVVEGYTDCIAAHQAGFPGVVASLGTALTESHVDLLRRYGPNIVVLFDSDEAGETAARRAIEVALPRCVNVRLAKIPEGCDPADYLQSHGAQAFSDVLNKAVDALEFMWSHTLQRFGGGESQAGRRDAVLGFLRLVSAACEGNAVDVIQRGLVINQVAHLLQMDRREVDRLARRLGGRPQRALPVARADESSARALSADAEQAARVRLLEVVLNEPGLLQTLEEAPQWSRISDPVDRRIGEVLGKLSAQLGEFRLVDALASFDRQDEVARIAELAARGAARGNLEATFREDIARLREQEHARGLDERTRRLLSDGDAPMNDATVEQETVEEGLKGRRHFVPRRLLRQNMPTLGTVVAEADNREETLEQQ